MFENDQYQLIDFGRGRKLERFGRYMIDRPAPAAEPYSQALPDVWGAAAAKFLLSPDAGGPQRGTWQWREGRDLSQEVQHICHASIQFELGWTPFGHVGLFPEQAPNWDWITHCTASAGRPLNVLNLFAYTGGSTLAAAAAGAQVTHVDASRSSVEWARRNAKHSGLAETPIRWIVEDACKYATRELRRGRRYDAVILDPPSYGHGPKGELWQIDRQLPELLDVCGQLLSDRPAFVLLTCHSPAWGVEQMQQALWMSLQRFSVAAHNMSIGSGPMELVSNEGRSLPSGEFVRVQWSEGSTR